MTQPSSPIQRIKIRCQCGKKIVLLGEFAGLSGFCPECQAPIQIPTVNELLQHKAKTEELTRARTQLMRTMHETERTDRDPQREKDPIEPLEEDEINQEADTAILDRDEILSRRLSDPMDELDMEADTDQLPGLEQLPDIKTEADSDKLPNPKELPELDMEADTLDLDEELG